MRAIALSVLLVGCANDPAYLQAPMTMEAGTDDGTGMLSQAKASLQLPIKTETAADKTKRDALAAQLGVAVPYVKVGDLELDVEWTITNLDTKQPGQVKIQLDGASEFFTYDPELINLAPPDAEDPPKTPGLAGDIPLGVPAGGTVSGLFTEDDLREAAIDIDQVTRGNVNPFRAVQTVSKNALSFQPMTVPAVNAAGEVTQSPVGPPVPREAFAGMVRIDLVFKPDRPMTLSFNVRVRDLRGILHDMQLSAKPAELQMFDPMPYAPVVGPATP